MGRKRRGSSSSSSVSASSFHPTVKGNGKATRKQAENDKAVVASSAVAQKDGTYSISPHEIYFTFSRIRPAFSCGRTIESTRQQFAKGELRVSDIPLLSVLTDGKGHYFSQNNRRLYLYKKLQQDGILQTIPVRVRPLPSTKRMNEKYTPEKCALKAKLMGMQPVGEGEGGGEEDEGVAGDGGRGGIRGNE